MLNYQYFESNQLQTIVLIHGFCEENTVFNYQIEASMNVLLT